MTVQPSNHSEMLALADSYLAAMTTNDPDRLPLAENVVFTENCQTLPVGSGHWRTVNTPVRTTAHVFGDAKRGHVAFWQPVREMEQPAILGVRLHLTDGLIDEVESLVVRRMWLFRPDGLAGPAPNLQRVVPPEERAGEDALLRVVDEYFEGLEHDDPSRMRVSADCVRFENGQQTTSNPDAAVEQDAPWRALSVLEQIRVGSFAHIESVRDRRYPIVDPERGLVLAHVTFDHPGDIRNPDGSLPFDARLPFGHPVSDVIYEVFKVEHDLIVDIRCLVCFMPYGTRSIWDRTAPEAPDGAMAIGVTR